MKLPAARGVLSEALTDALGGPVGRVDFPAVVASGDVVFDDEDLQLSLYVCYELHYRGFDGADPEWEWEPSMLETRRDLESLLLTGVEALVGPPVSADPGMEMDLALRAVVGDDETPALDRLIERHADLDQVREFLILKSAYQLKEADPHSFAIPRLSGPPKAAMVEIQADEYGSGRPERIHATLFANTLAEMGLDTGYGAYLDRIPAATLAGVNLVSLFGLHRRWRGACAGHLATFEMTSSLPNGRYARGLRRLGCSDAAADFFDEHVLADAVHENIAAVDLAGGLAAQEPDLAGDILWGARAMLAVEGHSTRRIYDAFEAGVTALRDPQRAQLGSAG